MAARPAAGRVEATVALAHAGAPKELHVKMRLSEPRKLLSATVNGRPATIGGSHNDTVIFPTGSASRFDIVGSY